MGHLDYFEYLLNETDLAREVPPDANPRGPRATWFKEDAARSRAVLAAAKSRIEASRARENEQRRQLYIIIGTIGIELRDEAVSAYLLARLRQETHRGCIEYILMKLARLPLGAEADLEPVFAAVRDPRWQVRWPAIEVLGKVGTRAAEDVLIGLLQTNEDPDDLTHACAALSRVGTGRAIPAIEPHTKARKLDLRHASRYAIAEIRQRVAAEAVDS